MVFVSAVIVRWILVCFVGAAFMAAPSLFRSDVTAAGSPGPDNAAVDGTPETETTLVFWRESEALMHRGLVLLQDSSYFSPQQTTMSDGARLSVVGAISRLHLAEADHRMLRLLCLDLDPHVVEAGWRIADAQLPRGPGAAFASEMASVAASYLTHTRHLDPWVIDALTQFVRDAVSLTGVDAVAFQPAVGLLAQCWQILREDHQLVTLPRPYGIMRARLIDPAGSIRALMELLVQPVEATPSRLARIAQDALAAADDHR